LDLTNLYIAAGELGFGAFLRKIETF